MGACHAIQHIAASVQANGAMQLAQAGSCAAARFAMDAHPGDALLQQSACHALESLAFGSSEACSQAVTDGAVEAVLQALKKHRKSTEVVQAALSALQAMVDG